LRVSQSPSEFILQGIKEEKKKTTTKQATQLFKMEKNLKKKTKKTQQTQTRKSNRTGRAVNQTHQKLIITWTRR